MMLLPICTSGMGGGGGYRVNYKVYISNYQTIEYWQDIPVVDVFISNFWKVYYCQLDCSELLMYVLFGLPNGQAGSSHY